MLCGLHLSDRERLLQLHGLSADTFPGLILNYVLLTVIPPNVTAV